ncbi:hypothetical protein [uncultured Mycolicibacterium sp.]|uniref:hypothetical protein n=1 Tax=uncultured Mycolicibacterium sp. TaxID=2320817 RepID=UPI0032B23638|tara:strand:- start:203 stop:466 length:264 start_codon:yes stop_codon:yes gene_type:complete
MTDIHPNAAHWHVFADLAGGTSCRAFPEALTEQQAHDLADTIAHVDGEHVSDAVWVHPCLVDAGCTFWGLSAAFDPDTAEPHWARTR